MAQDRWFRSTPQRRTFTEFLLEPLAFCLHEKGFYSSRRVNSGQCFITIVTRSWRMAIRSRASYISLQGMYSPIRLRSFGVEVSFNGANPSYAWIKVVGKTGLEPATLDSQSRCATIALLSDDKSFVFNISDQLFAYFLVKGYRPAHAVEYKIKFLRFINLSSW